MKRHPITSSNIQSAGFDREREILEIAFKSGSTYRYAGVTFTVYQAFLDAPSQGAFVAKHIKPNYPAENVGDGDEKPV